MAAQKAPLNQGIANFYDESSGLWEQMWGEHMHHGYYPKGGAAKSNQEAQVDMIEEVLAWAGATSAKQVHGALPRRRACSGGTQKTDRGQAAAQVLDVGCGIGGSSRHIARKFGCAARGITLSPVQVLGSPSQ